MKRKPKWVSKTVALAIHELLLAEHGGASGFVDEGRLDAALASPRNHLVYQKADVFSLAAAYAHAITRNHPFKDGNKRLALTITGVFLELNGYRLDAPETDAVSIVLALSRREIDEQAFGEWLRNASSKVQKTKSRGSDARTAKRRSPPRPKK